MLKAVIFDKDGVLVDTEGVVIDALESVIKKYSNVPLDPNDSKGQRGSSARATFEFVNEKYKLPFSVEESLDKYSEEYRSIIAVKNNLVMDGVIELLDDLKKNNILFGIATNSNRERTDLTMKDLNSYFDVVVTSDDVEIPKPAPEPFLKVSKMLDVSPDSCVVIGDTNNDSLAANAARMKFVFRDHDLGLEISHKPDLVIRSMRDLSAGKLQSLFT